jgi:hypothetical protein
MNCNITTQFLAEHFLTLQVLYKCSIWLLLVMRKTSKLIQIFPTVCPRNWHLPEQWCQQSCHESLEGPLAWVVCRGRWCTYGQFSVINFLHDREYLHQIFECYTLLHIIWLLKYIFYFGISLLISLPVPFKKWKVKKWPQVQHMVVLQATLCCTLGQNSTEG